VEMGDSAASKTGSLEKEKAREKNSRARLFW
jgi:hypothetical protein